MAFSMVTGSSNNSQRTPPRALASPPENVTADFALTQVVTLGQPYNTPKAANIRAFVAARLLNNDNQRLFLFRKETGNTWTNIALDSTPAAPKLTAPPAEIGRKLETILASCPDVNQVIMRGPDGQSVSAEDVSNIQFTPLDEQAVSEPAAEVVTPSDNNALMRQMKEMDTKVDDLAFMLKADHVEFKAALESKLDHVIAEVDRKLTHIVDVLNDTVERPVAAVAAGSAGRSVSPVDKESEVEVDEVVTVSRGGRAGKQRKQARLIL